MDNLHSRIAKDEGLVKWFQYGFKYLTRISETNISAILSYCRSILHMSDDNIMKLATASYCPSGIMM